MRLFPRIFQSLNQMGIVIGCITMALVMVIIIANVIVRLFGSVIPGTYSIVVLLAVFMVCPAILYTQFEKKHILIDFLSGRFSRRTQVFLGWVSDILALAILAVMCWATIPYAWTMWFRPELQDPLNIPVAPFRFIWGIALFLCFLAVIASWFKPSEGSEPRLEKEV